MQRKLTLELGYEPSVAELAEALEMTEDKVMEIMQIAREPASLETPIGEEDDSNLGDFVADSNVVTPEGDVESVMLREHIDALLGDLKERERQVIVLRFGLEDGHPRTLEEVGKEFNVTRERIRQIEAKALRKLRNPVRSKRIRDFCRGIYSAAEITRRTGRRLEKKKGNVPSSALAQLLRTMQQLCAGISF